MKTSIPLIANLVFAAQFHAKPLKVFTLANPSNLERHVKVETSKVAYHNLGCAKTFALMGKALAEATLQILNQTPAQ